MIEQLLKWTNENGPCTDHFYQWVAEMMIEDSLIVEPTTKDHVALGKALCAGILQDLTSSETQTALDSLDASLDNLIGQDEALCPLVVSLGYDFYGPAHSGWNAVYDLFRQGWYVIRGSDFNEGPFRDFHEGADAILHEIDQSSGENEDELEVTHNPDYYDAESKFIGKTIKSVRS